jgi:hypothetical protein
MVIAIVVAVIALGGATVAWLTYFRGRRTAVSVEITQLASRAPMLMLDGDPRPEPVFHAIEVAVVNRGPVPESVAFLAVQQAGDDPERAGYDITAFLPGVGDSEVGVRKRITAEVALTDLGFDPVDGFFAVARLASGKTVVSSREVPDPDVVARITAHNRNARP